MQIKELKKSMKGIKFPHPNTILFFWINVSHVLTNARETRVILLFQQSF